MTLIPRRSFLAASSVALAAPTAAAPAAAAAMRRRNDGGLPESFPTQDPDQVRDVVGKAHTDYQGVEDLVTARPALARAAWDWGFGDWESALGAASHMGRRDIAEVLIAHGARPDLFTFAMLDQIDVVRALCTANPGIQALHGPHGITLLAHARMGKAAAVIEYLEQLGGADAGQVDLPLDESTARSYLGDYLPQGAPWTRFHIGLNERRKCLTFQRDDRVARFLAHRGEHRFNPGGAAAVEFVFEIADGRAASLSIRDGALLIVASRAPAP